MKPVSEACDLLSVSLFFATMFLTDSTAPAFTPLMPATVTSRHEITLVLSLIPQNCLKDFFNPAAIPGIDFNSPAGQKNRELT